MKPFAIDESGLSGTRFPGDASWQTLWRRCEWAQRIEYGIDWLLAGGAAPAGTLILEGALAVATPGFSPPTELVFAIPAPAGTAGTYGAWPNVAAASGQAAIIVANPMAFHRMTFVHSGGGGANQFRVHCIITPR